MKVIGEPQFGNKAKLEVVGIKNNITNVKNNKTKGAQANSPAESLKAEAVASAEKGVVFTSCSRCFQSIKIKIPLADGNPDSRVFAYDVVIVGDDPNARLFKSVYFEGCNSGIGHEPNHGITEVEIPVAKLPAGKKLTIAVRPLSSLGTKGKAIGTTWRT